MKYFHSPVVYHVLRYIRFIIQHIVTLPKYDHGPLNIRRPVNNRYPAIYVISCVGEKNDKALNN